MALSARSATATPRIAVLLRELLHCAQRLSARGKRSGARPLARCAASHQDALSARKWRGREFMLHRSARRAAMALGAAALFVMSPARAADEFINILTGGTSGAYYPM